MKEKVKNQSIYRLFQLPLLFILFTSGSFGQLRANASPDCKYWWYTHCENMYSDQLNGCIIYFIKIMELAQLVSIIYILYMTNVCEQAIRLLGQEV
jgi:hypothetical protein